MIKEFQREYRWLSNFWPCTIQYQGRTYKSVEAAYMSAKSENPKWKLFCQQNSPSEIKRASKALKMPKNWEAIKTDVMFECLCEKFSIPLFQKKLINTGTEEIQEGNMWHDTFWGVDLRTGMGENNLGKLIMQIRDLIKKDAL